MRTVFASSARANERMDERVHIHNIRDFPQARLDREINARFLLNEHGDLFLYFRISMRTISLVTEKKNKAKKSMATFLATGINSTGEDITGRTAQIVCLR